MSFRPISLLAAAGFAAGCAGLDTVSVQDAPSFEDAERPGFRQRRDIRPSEPTPSFGTGIHSDNYG